MQFTLKIDFYAYTDRNKNICTYFFVLDMAKGIVFLSDEEYSSTLGVVAFRAFVLHNDLYDCDVLINVNVL